MKHYFLAAVAAAAFLPGLEAGSGFSATSFLGGNASHND